MQKTTIARPYAKALFALAKQQKQLDVWQQWLTVTTDLFSHDIVKKLLLQPDFSSQQLNKTLVDLCGQLITDKKFNTTTMQQSFSNFIQVLQTNKRLLLLSEICNQFVELYKQHQQQSQCHVISAIPLSKDLTSKLQQALQQRFKHDIAIIPSIDENIIAGLIIKKGDWVLNYSLRHKINQLKHQLLSN